MNGKLQIISKFEVPVKTTSEDSREETGIDSIVIQEEELVH